jgi:isochorismate hydrolase
MLKVLCKKVIIGVLVGVCCLITGVNVNKSSTKEVNNDYLNTYNENQHSICLQQLADLNHHIHN